MEGRVPPHSLEAEKAVLGALLLSGEAYESISHIVKTEDFYRESHRIIFEAITNIIKQNKRADTILLTQELTRMQKLEAAGDIAYVMSLTEDSLATYNVEEHARIVSEKAQLRKLIDVATKIEGMSYTGEERTEDIVNKAEQMVLDVSGQSQGESSFSPMGEVVMETLERISRMSNHDGLLTGLSTGFRDLDALTSGLQQSDLILVAARPSMGKTAFTLNIAQNVAMRQNKTVAFFSLEMSKEQLVGRILASVATVDSNRLRRGQLDNRDWESVMKAMESMSKANLFIDDTSGLTPQMMLKKLRRLKVEHGLDLVVVDYIQLMENGGTRNKENRQQEVSAISRQLKLIARELNVPLIALSQLSRGVESRQDKTPMLSDLRESGSLEQDADIVAFLNRDNYQDTQDTSEGVETQIIIRKHRNGELGVITLWFEGRYTRFRDFSPRVDDPNL